MDEGTRTPSSRCDTTTITTTTSCQKCTCTCERHACISPRHQPPNTIIHHHTRTTTVESHVQDSWFTRSLSGAEHHQLSMLHTHSLSLCVCGAVPQHSDPFLCRHSVDVDGPWSRRRGRRPARRKTLHTDKQGLHFSVFFIIIIIIIIDLVVVGS